MPPALLAQECLENTVVHFVRVRGAGGAVSSFFLRHVLEEEGSIYRGENLEDNAISSASQGKAALGTETGDLLPAKCSL